MAPPATDATGVTCPGCKAVFSASGFTRHIRSARNPLCAALRAASIRGPVQAPSLPDRTNNDANDPIPSHSPSLEPLDRALSEDPSRSEPPLTPPGLDDNALDSVLSDAGGIERPADRADDGMDDGRSSGHESFANSRRSSVEARDGEFPEYDVQEDLPHGDDIDYDFGYHDLYADLQPEPPQDGDGGEPDPYGWGEEDDRLALNSAAGGMSDDDQDAQDDLAEDHDAVFGLQAGVADEVTPGEGAHNAPNADGQDAGAAEEDTDSDLDPMDEDKIDQMNRGERLEDEARLRRDAEVVKFTIGKAGAPIPGAMAPPTNAAYKLKVGGAAEADEAEADENPWAPFTSQMDWEMAQWAKMRGPTSTAFTELLNIDGVADKLGLSYKNSAELNKIIDQQLPPRPKWICEEVEVHGKTFEVYYRDVLECIRTLYGNPEFSKYMVYAPEKHFTDKEKTSRVYHEMHTGDWWWRVQVALEAKKQGATIIPCIWSSDKTQVTVFRNKSAYPVYLTIGNIAKDIRRKPSKQAHILVAYLPTDRLDHIKSNKTRRKAVANLFHACMSRIMESVKAHAVNGVAMAGGDGVVRCCHPIFAVFVGDYPEQVLVGCVKSGQCPKCEVDPDDLGELFISPNRKIIPVLNALKAIDRGPAEFVAATAAAGIKPVVKPFWEDLPYANVFQSFTPDLLHQLYQGVVKHVIGWVKKAYGQAELDARCSRMPPNHNLRLFSSGISHLSRVSGQEHKDICRILLGLVIGLRLPRGLSGVVCLSNL
ncbi:hypothetical protein BV25DRAFT_1919489 [Artomyces pyxidatus]|uniref:Uncharacterized protein n=1 Tax=Artomyces pyxidatus TaxID=48021 RepID=A0ACB8SPJ1_9AGAM|nr:hypothetical protein BV25DRAFT_1919489 [Artomyces pyxidatus]